MRFLPEVPHQGEEWSARTVARLTVHCGTGTPHLWLVRLTREEAPALNRWLTSWELSVGDLLRSPQGREHALDAFVLAVLRKGTSVIAPHDDYGLRLDDRLLVACGPSARRALDATLCSEPTAVYVVEGRVVPSSWIWRRLFGHGREQRRPPPLMPRYTDEGAVSPRPTAQMDY